MKQTKLLFRVWCLVLSILVFLFMGVAAEELLKADNDAASLRDEGISPKVGNNPIISVKRNISESPNRLEAVLPNKDEENIMGEFKKPGDKKK